MAEKPTPKDWVTNPERYRIPGTHSHSIQILQDFFSLEDGVLCWAKSPAPRIKPGMEAGALHVDRKRGFTNGIRVRFRGTLLLAEDIAFTISRGRHVEQGKKIIHQDGNRTNNSPENLLEVAQVVGDPLNIEDGMTIRPNK